MDKLVPLLLLMVCCTVHIAHGSSSGSVDEDFVDLEPASARETLQAGAVGEETLVIPAQASDTMTGAEGLEPEVEEEDDEERPGFKLRITQNGLNYVNDIAKSIFARQILNVRIPDIEERVNLVFARATVRISNIHLSQFPDFESRFVPVPGLGLRWTATQMWPVVQANYNARVKKWLININKSGTVSIRYKRGMSLQLEFMIDKDDDGKPTVNVFFCRAGGKIKVDFRGGWSEGLDLAGVVLKRKLSRILHDKICEEATREINEKAAWALSKFSTRETLMDKYTVDFGLLDAPDFNRTYGLESEHRGAIYAARQMQEPPFEPPHMSSYLDLTDNMAYAFISSYLLNTGLYAAWANNQLRLNVTHDRASEEVRKYFAMSCPEEVCIGALYPGFAARYPHAMGQVYIQASRSPEIHFRSGMITLDAGVDVDVYASQSGHTRFLVGAHLSVRAQLTVRIEDRKIMFNVTQIMPRAHVRRTSEQDAGIDAFLQRMLAMGTDRYLVPFIADIGSKGIELPDIETVRFQNPVVLIPYDDEGVMIIGTDLYYEGAM